MRKRIVTEVIMMFVLLSLFTGCSSNKAAKLVNTQTFDVAGIKNIIIDYDEEDITLYESDADNFILKEYMTTDKSGYYAKVIEKNGNINISEGARPLFRGDFNRYVEIYLPASYTENLSLHTTNGNIKTNSVSVDLAQFYADSTSGTVQLGTINANSIEIATTSGTVEAETIIADNIKIKTSSGNVNCGEINGAVDYDTTSGSLLVYDASGSGSYNAAQSGTIDVTYKQVIDDLSLYNKNDNVVLTLPSDLSFKFKATTRNGSIKTSFGEQLSTTGSVQEGTVGTSPTVSIEVETRNGGVQVTQ